MAAKLKTLEPRDTSFVLVYDPKELSEIQLDKIRVETPFEVLVSAKQAQAIFLASEKLSTKVTIQPTRLELVQELRTPFEERSLEDLRKLIAALPELSVKAFGINYAVWFAVDGYGLGGQYVRDHFLKGPTGIEGVMGSAVVSNSTRLIFGDPEDYRDIRLTPLDLQGEIVVLQYHCHKEEEVKDRERMFRLINERYPIETRILSNLIEKL